MCSSLQNESVNCETYGCLIGKSEGGRRVKIQFSKKRNRIGACGLD
jgi:hypothetical protein